MSKIVGAVAGAAIGFITGGPVGAIRGAIGGYVLIDALTSKKQNSSAYTESASPTYSFGPLQTQVSNTMPRPIIYGEVKVAGNKIWQEGENTSTIKQIVVLCDGEINAINDVKLNDYDITTLPGCSVSKYYGDGIQSIDDRVPGTQEVKASKVGGLKYDAYLAITAQASDKIPDSGFNVTCIVQGKKVRVYTNPTTYTVQYSNNPAWCILDFLTCYNGMGLSYDEIDIQSFIDAANYCSALVDGESRFSLNIILDTRRSRLDWLSSMLLVCRGYTLYQNGVVHLKIDQAGSSVQSFDENNIIAGTEKFWTTPRENWYDIVKVQFIDPDNEYARVYAIAESPSYNNEQPIIKSVEAFGITSFKQASRLAWFYQNEASTTNKFLSFKTTKEGLDRTVGDIIEVSSVIMGYTKKLFRIISMSEEQEGQIEITCKEYNANLYNDTTGSVAPSIDIIGSDGNVFTTEITDITLQGTSDVDQVRRIQLLIDNLSEKGGGYLNIDSQESGGILINGSVNVKSNVHLNFKCPVIFGAYGQLRIYGGFEETPIDPNPLPKIGADCTVGSTRIYLGNQPESLASNYSIGDKIIIRGLTDGNGEAIEMQELTVTAVNTTSNYIDVLEPLEYAYKVTYPAGDFEANFGTVDRTFITFLTHTRLSADASRGDTTITVTNATGFAENDYVFFGDTKTPSAIAGTSTNTFRHEVNKITNITGTTITLENPLCHDYETSYSAYIIKMNMVSNSSIRGAKVNYNANPFEFTTNAFTIAYAKDCWIQDCAVLNDGAYKSRGHGFRIDRSINCHTYNCAVYPPGFVDAAEGYGFTFYRSNHCSHNNSYARGCRHSFLFFRGSSHNRFNNVTSVACRKSDIDFHGGDEYGNIVDGFTIVGQDPSQIIGNNLEAIKFGNESHVAGSHNNVVRNGIITDYSGFAISFVPTSSNNLVENVTVRNANRFIRCVDLSVDSTLVAKNNTIRNCFVESLKERLCTIDGTQNGGSSQIIDGLVIDGCTFRGFQEYFRTFTNTINCKIINNRILDALDATGEPDPYIIRAINSDNLLIQNNYIEKGTRFLKIQNCKNLVCIDNTLKDFYETEVLDDVSGNDGYIFKYNDFIGFDETYSTSGGGSSGGTIRNKFQSHIESSLSSATFPMVVTSAIPFDNTTPLISEGSEILSYSYTPKNMKSKLKIDVYVPAVFIPTDSPQPPATNVVLSLFSGSTCIGASGIRLPNTGESSGHQISVTALVDLSDKSSITFSARIGPKSISNGEKITVGSRFNGLSTPFIVIQEMY